MHLDDKERFLQCMLEAKAGMEAGVVGSGHSFAASRLAAQRSTAGAPRPRFPHPQNGISYHRKQVVEGVY